MKRCLVIGGGGFLGRHIVEKLLAIGADVNIFDIRKTFDDKRIKFFVGNLCNKAVSTNGLICHLSVYPVIYIVKREDYAISLFLIVL